MSLTRQVATHMAEEELLAMAGHLINLDAVCTTGKFAEWRAGIEQLRQALARMSSDIETTRTARVQ